MKLFLDSSALAKRYIREKGSEVVAAHFKEAKALGLSILSFPEVISALSRLVREKKLSAFEYAVYKREIIHDLEDADLVTMTDEVIEQSVLLLENHQLRTLDAIHVASATCWKADVFLSANKQQTKAARQAGLTVKFVGL